MTMKQLKVITAVAVFVLAGVLLNWIIKYIAVGVLWLSDALNVPM